MSSMGAPSRNNPKSIILWYSSTFQRLTRGPKPALPVKIAGAASTVISGSSCRSILPLCLHRLNRAQLFSFGHLADVLRDLHGAILGPAHRAEVGRFERILRQR